MDEDLFVFREENEPETRQDTGENAWQVLIIDDDEDVHEATIFSLKDTVIFGKPIEFLHAYSGKEGIEILSRNPDIPLILLDAIMETEDAGLAAVRKIREDLGLQNVRIILRTGQPGQVPELETITRYDINDYKTKSELTRTKLVTSITTALRSWMQLIRVEQSRLGLEKIITASNHLIAEQGLGDFADGVITQIAGLFDLAPEGIVCVSGNQGMEHPDKDCKIIAAAGNFRPFINKSLSEIERPEISSAISKVMVKKDHIVDAKSLTVYFQEPSGKSYITWIGSSIPIQSIDSHLLEIFCSNISLCASNVELVSRLKSQAWKDPVLNIPNLTALLEELNCRLKADLSERKEAVGVLDIAGFGQINDLLGHDYGDAILKAMVDKLKAKIGTSFLARISADVFALVGDQTLFSSENLQNLTSITIQTPDGERELAVSIGVSPLDPEEGGASSQLRNGYIALKHAKAEGPGKIVSYSRAIGDRTREGIRLLHDLRGGIKGNELFLTFQPQILIEDRRVFCCETLLRWRNKEGMLIPPDRFIPLAEQAGLIIPIGNWVLKSSLLALRKIHDAGFNDMHIAVNVSAMQLFSKDFLVHLDTALTESGVDPRFLELEITESIGISGIPTVLNLLQQLQDRRISIAIDDFGTGYSSLASIDMWPINRIKIDRSFIANMERQREGARLLDLVIPLANRLSLRVIAEGVETESQFDWLQSLHCHEAQGYLISKPLELDSFIPWMQTYQTQKRSA